MTLFPALFCGPKGGSLDISFVQTYRGGGRLVATIPVLVGGSALVELGKEEEEEEEEEGLVVVVMVAVGSPAIP